jgi:hypothetical protein
MIRVFVLVCFWILPTANASCAAERRMVSADCFAHTTTLAMDSTDGTDLHGSGSSIGVLNWEIRVIRVHLWRGLLFSAEPMPTASGFRLWAHPHKTVQLNKTFCYLFTQIACLFEMIIRTYLS